MFNIINLSDIMMMETTVMPPGKSEVFEIMMLKYKVVISDNGPGFKIKMRIYFDDD